MAATEDIALPSERGSEKLTPVKGHPLSEHRFVVHDYGADIHLNHKPSGLTLHLHSCFLGADLNAATIDEKLGDCYLPLAAIVHFFELIEFTPGISHSGRVYDTLTTYEQKSEMWVDALLVADLLGLHTMVKDLFNMVKSPPRIPHSTLLMAIEDRRVHSKDVIKSICEFAMFAVDDIFNDEMDAHEVTRLLAPLATDPSYGVECYGKIIAKSVEHHTAHMMRKEDTSALDLLYDDSIGPLRSSDVTSAWRRGFAQFFDVYIGFAKKHRSSVYSCVPALSTATDDEMLAQLPLVVTVDTGYVRSEPYLANPHSYLPYRIRRDEEEKTIQVCMSDNRTVASVFGDSIRDGDLIVVADEDCDVHLIGKVKDLDEWSMTIDVPLVTKDVKRDQFSIRDVLSVKFGTCRGHYRLSAGTRFKDTLIEVMPGYNHTREEIGVVAVQDPVLATANFVVQCDNLSGDCVQYGFLVHDWILHQTWSYFQSVVDAGMSEMTERSVSFCGMPPLTLRALMSCLYTGNAEDCSHAFSSQLVDEHLEYIDGDSGILFDLRSIPALKSIVKSRASNMYSVPLSWTGTYMLGSTSIYPSGFSPSVNILPNVSISTSGTGFTFSSYSPMY
jgi:hypothetical protein